MHEDLVKRLKICADETAGCNGCPYQNGYIGHFCMDGLIIEAIDAIEKQNERIDFLTSCVHKARALLEEEGLKELQELAAKLEDNNESEM